MHSNTFVECRQCAKNILKIGIHAWSILSEEEMCQREKCIPFMIPDRKKLVTLGFNEQIAEAGFTKKTNPSWLRI